MAGSVEDLALYRYRLSLEEIDTAEQLINEKRYRLSLSRSYYAIFYAMRSVNALDDFDSKKHSGVISHFNHCHIKNGDFPKETSQIIKSAFQLRGQADYDDFFIASRQDAAEQLNNGKILIRYIGDYLRQKGIYEDK